MTEEWCRDARTGRSQRTSPRHLVARAFRTSARTITETDLANFVCASGFVEPLFLDARHGQVEGSSGRFVPAVLTLGLAEGLVVRSRVFHGQRRPCSVSPSRSGPRCAPATPSQWQSKLSRSPLPPTGFGPRWPPSIPSSIRTTASSWSTAPSGSSCETDAGIDLTALTSGQRNHYGMGFDNP